MNKNELVAEIAQKAGISQGDASSALDALTETVEESLARGEEVSITGFGKWSVAERQAREGRNPATGEPMSIAASKAPKFSAGAKLKQALKS